MNIRKNILSVALIFMMMSGIYAQSRKIEVKADETKEKVEVFVDGSLFTAFCYPSGLEKPFLYPVYSPNGSVITRGYPLEPRKGERVDHPHQLGMWLTFGDVNGIDFWGNSFAIKDKTGYGHVQFIKLLKAKGGKKGQISYLAEWRDHKEEAMLEEQTTFFISAEKDSRTIDRITTLKALDKGVTFTDNKEGMLAIRVDRAFETPSNTPQIFIDDHGNPETVEAKADNTGVNGVYYSSNGKTGDDVWGTRNDWVMLRGEKDGTLITFGFFDHPENAGYPFHSHARGYGLFSCCNLGSKSYNKNDEKIVVKIKPGEKLIFKHRFYIRSGQPIPSDEANEMFRKFSKTY